MSETRNLLTFFFVSFAIIMCWQNLKIHFQSETSTVINKNVIVSSANVDEKNEISEEFSSNPKVIQSLPGIAQSLDVPKSPRLMEENIGAWFLSADEALSMCKEAINIETDKILARVCVDDLSIDNLILKDYKAEATTNEGVHLLAPVSYKFGRGEYRIGVNFIKGIEASSASEELPSSWEWSVMNADSKSNSYKFLGVDRGGTTKTEVEIVAIDDYLLSVNAKLTNGSKVPGRASIEHKISRISKDLSESETILIMKENSVDETNAIVKTKGGNSVKKAMQDIFWIGVLEKYWGIIIGGFDPGNRLQPFAFSSAWATVGNRYHMDSTMRGEYIGVQSGKEVNLGESFIYVGPKDIDILGQYGSKYKIRALDRAVSFGKLHIVVRWINSLYRFVYRHVGSNAISILLTTALVKLLMQPLIFKSQITAHKMQTLQPEIDRLKLKYPDNNEYSQKFVELLKKNNLNPLSGIVPLLLQMPIFFAMYKFVSLSIDMRMAEFGGWIHDMSIPDPADLHNFFADNGISWPSFLNVSILSCLFSVSMFWYNLLHASGIPQSSQNKSLIYLTPIMCAIIFSSMPAGLVIYWTWSNVLSVLQQWTIGKLIDRQNRRKILRI